MSIRNRLQLWLLSALLLVSSLIAATSFVVEHIRVRDSENRRLQRIAESIPPRLKSADLSKINIKLLHGPDDFMLQIWDTEGRLVYQSHPDLTLPGFATVGFSTANWNGERWKVFMRRSDTNTIQVAQSLDARARRVRRHALHAIVPPLLVIPLFGLCVPLCLNRGLRSLDHFSQQLTVLDPNALAPLPPSPQPAEIKPLKTALDSLLQRLSHASDMQRDFIADASHELRTPLATLRVQTQLVEQSLGTGKEREALADLHAGIKRASHLLEQLLMASRLESNSPAESHRELSLDELAREVTMELLPFAHSRQIDLGVERLQPGPIAGSEQQIRLVIRNLIDNAIRYTPSPGQVDVEVVQEHAQVRLIVEDSGPGIPAAERSRVFDRFYRCLGHELPGSGLGLAIVKQVLDRHEANITLCDAERLPGLRAMVSFQSLTLNMRS